MKHNIVTRPRTVTVPNGIYWLALMSVAVHFMKGVALILARLAG